MKIVHVSCNLVEVNAEPFLCKHWVREHFHRESSFHSPFCLSYELGYRLCSPFRPVQPASPPKLHASWADTEFFLWKMIKVQRHSLYLLFSQLINVIQNFSLILWVRWANKIKSQVSFLVFSQCETVLGYCNYARVLSDGFCVAETGDIVLHFVCCWEN